MKLGTVEIERAHRRRYLGRREQDRTHAASLFER